MISTKFSIHLTSFLAISCLAATACDDLLGKERNPDYCGSDPCPPPDSGGCSSNTDCGSSGVCDVSKSRCVQCTATDHGACTANTPVCGTDDACRACAAHSECPSDACSLGDGSCVAETDVAYVDERGTANATCLSSMPCTSIMAALATGRAYVKVHGTIKEMVTVGNARVVTVLADPDAMLTHDGVGAVLTVSGNSTSVTVYDLRISSAGGSGVSVPTQGEEPTLSLIHTEISNHLNGGINIQAGNFTLVRSKVTNNPGGGVVIDGTATFYIVGNDFFANGNPLSTTGAVRIKARQSPINRLDFNSFLNNQTSDRGGAIQCDAGTTFMASNNIIYNPAINAEPITGSCMHAYSLIQPGTVPSGANNIAGDPRFANLSTGDLHLMSGSPAFHAANPNSNVEGLALHDIDGTPRLPPPATIGAYQMQ